jgi:hypothetical protein
MEPHTREIYRRIRTELPDAQILYLMPFLIDSVEEKLPFHKMLDEFRQVLKDIALENGAAVVDLQEKQVTVIGDASIDLLKKAITDAGYEVVG